MQMKVLVNLIKRWRNRRRKTEWSNKLREIKDSFQVKELNGTLYLMCQGVPYKEVPHLLSAEEITALLEEARGAMKHYLISKDDEPTEKIQPC